MGGKLVVVVVLVVLLVIVDVVVYSSDGIYKYDVVKIWSHLGFINDCIFQVIKANI